MVHVGSEVPPLPGSWEKAEQEKPGSDAEPPAYLSSLADFVSNIASQAAQKLSEEEDAQGWTWESALEKAEAETDKLLKDPALEIPGADGAADADDGPTAIAQAEFDKFKEAVDNKEFDMRGAQHQTANSFEALLA